MGVPLAEHFGPLGDPPEREGGIYDALHLTATSKVVRHGTIDPAILSIDESEVLVLRGTRTVDLELLANMQQHFIFEACRRRRVARPGRDTHGQQYPRRSEYAERMVA